MRASDLERQRTIDELRRHCAAGRIDVDEYASRIEKAMSATTLEELDHLRSDLPMMRIADPTGAGPGPIRARAALTGGGAEEASAPGRRVTAVALAVVAALVVLAVLVLALIAEWAWAAVLLVGWVAGVVTGRLSRRPGRR